MSWTFLANLFLLGKIVLTRGTVFKVASSFPLEVPQRKTQSGCFDLDSSLLQLKCLSARRYVLFTRNIKNLKRDIMYIHTYMQQQSMIADQNTGAFQKNPCFESRLGRHIARGVSRLAQLWDITTV